MSRSCISLVAAAALAACAESSVVEPDVRGAAATRELSAAPSRAAAPSRPAGGTCTLVGRALLPPQPGQPANVVRRHVDWVCQLKHLGRTTASVQETATLGPTGAILTNTTVYTAANGDQLFVVYNATATLPDQNGVVSFSGTETVTGGTGRFADASGSLSRIGSVSVVTLSGQYETRGTLSY